MKCLSYIKSITQNSSIVITYCQSFYYIFIPGVILSIRQLSAYENLVCSLPLFSLSQSNASNLELYCLVLSLGCVVNLTSRFYDMVKEFYMQDVLELIVAILSNRCFFSKDDSGVYAPLSFLYF